LFETVLSCLAQESAISPAINNCEHACETHSHNSLDLDLSSTVASVVFSPTCNQSSVDIQIGGNNETQTILPGQMLTPAQLIAAYQVMHHGTQSILLNNDGAAIGGSMIIRNHLANILESLVIPNNVTVIDHTASLNLSGNLTNAGTLNAITNNPNINTASITAANIFNQQNALITSTLNLNLTAINNIINAGIIYSASDLNLAAGNSIINTLPANISGPSPIMQAMNNINIIASNITNSGLIAAQTGNININTQIAQDILISAMAGQFSAVSGAINIRDANFNAMNNLTINGGDYLSKYFNLYSGSGEINGNFGLVTGDLSSYAGIEHIFANTPTLSLGNTCITGDPTYANLGNIIINGSLNFGTDNVAIIAEGNITSGTGSNQAQIITDGGSVTLVAGADILSISGTANSDVNSTTSTVSGVSFAFNNSQGGNIDFTNSNTSPVIETNGGDVTLLANDSTSAANSGNIWFNPSTVSINTSNNNGLPGDVLIVAGGSGGTGSQPSSTIQTGYVFALGTSQSTTVNGSITILAAQPIIVGNNGIAVFDNTGALVAGDFPSNSLFYTFTPNAQINSIVQSRIEIPFGPASIATLLGVVEAENETEEREQEQDEEIGTRIATDYTPIIFPSNLADIDAAEASGGGKQLPQANPHARLTGRSFNANQLKGLINQGVKLGSKSSGNFLDLVSGNILIMPEADTKVQTHAGIIDIPKGAIALVVDTDESVTVYDLHDSQARSIKVTVNNKDFVLSPGKELLLTNDKTASFESLDPDGSIGHRNIQSKNIDENTKSYICDFSITSSLMNNPNMHSLLISSDKSERKAASKLIKNAVILADLTGYGYKAR
jgi:hypothetical protein